MTKIIVKFTILFIPILLLISICLAVGLHFGEIYPLSYVAELQSEDRKIQYNLTGTGTKHMQYKYESILVQEPSLLLMGSSRAWYFREQIANRCLKEFYNASYGNSSIFEIAAMLQKVIDNGKNPEVILLSLDDPDYNAESDYKGVIRQLDETSAWEYFIDSAKRMIIQVIIHPDAIGDMMNSPKSDSQLGWGFVYDEKPNYYSGDGNYIESKFDETYLPVGLDIHHVMIQNGELQYQSGFTVDNSALQALKTVLQLSSDNNIEVIGFIPPFHEEIRNKLEDGTDFAYIPLVHDEINDAFESYEFKVYDFSDSKSVGGTDAGMYDGWHSGELLSTQIYLQLLRNEPEILSKYSDIDYLEDLIESASDPYNLNIDRAALIKQQSCE